MRSRSTITIEDLGSKGGTKVNGHKYRSETCTLTQDSNTLQMGSFPPLFRYRTHTHNYPIFLRARGLVRKQVFVAIALTEPSF